ncbi:MULTISPECIES: aminopeptidase N [Corynebacterium]|uniref:aminopeptidase N n=1 Tax=Corynebacterium TaxID=1716 RepID=UPI00124CF2CB|nr:MULTISPECIES: aminopeptidase N [Corynebacterium]
MTSVNLTRDEARARAAMLQTEHYDIALDLTTSDETFRSTTTVHFTVKEAGDSFIDLRDAHIHSASLDGEDFTPEYSSEHGLQLKQLSVGEHTLVVDADCTYSHSGQGLHRYVDPADDKVYLYSQFETADAKRVYACFDQPDLKATYRLSAVTPQDWIVITNGETTCTESEGKRVHTADFPYPISTYIAAVCAGPYHEVRETWTGTLTHHPETPADQPTDLEIPMGLYCRASLADSLDAERIFTETRQGFDFYHRNFGVAYPFGKYDQVFVPEFNMGAMENAGCVTHRDEYVFDSQVTHYMYERRADTILHEMAHMWFGDLVTMEWWDDLWLNESFATWAAAISQAEETRYDTAWTTFAFVEKSWAYSQDQLPSTHPISTDASDIETVEQNFDGITYAKGASVLKQLQAYVGREEFFAGVRRHFARHAFGNATFDDLLASLEEASGRDLSDWSSQWLKTTGINSFSVESTSSDGVYDSFAIVQSGATPGAGETRTHRLAVGLYNLQDSAVVRTQRIELDVDGERTEVTDLIGTPEADLVLVNDDDLTYCLYEADEQSLAFIGEHIDAIEDSMARALCWSAASQATRDGRMPARDFLALVQRGITSETELAVLERILLQARITLRSYADPEWAEQEGKQAFARTLFDALSQPHDLAAGTDAQLPFFKALAQVEFGDNEAAFFRSILEGTCTVPELEVDSNIRWSALTALIARGDIADPEAAIAAERERDATGSGQKSAWRAAAAINTAENKAQVYERLSTAAGEISNLELRHTLEGLLFAGSAPNLEQFNERFVELAPQLWADLPNETAQPLLEGIYPSWDISAEGIERSTQLLDADIPSALARLVAENVDAQQRALRNREVDARAGERR